MTSLGNKIRAARMAKGLSQEDLATLVGVEPASVSRWENGVNKPKRKLPKIAEKLGKPVEWFQSSEDPQILKKIDELESRLNEMSVVNKEQMSTDQITLLNIYNGLNPSAKPLVISLLRRLSTVDESEFGFIETVIGNLPNVTAVLNPPAPAATVHKIVARKKKK